MEANKYINLGRAFGFPDVDLSSHPWSVFHNGLDNCDAFSQEEQEYQSEADYRSFLTKKLDTCREIFWGDYTLDWRNCLHD